MPKIKHRTINFSVAPPRFVIAAGAIAALLGLGKPAWARPALGGFVEGIQALRLEENVALDGGLAFEERAYPRSELRAQLTVADSLGSGAFFLRTDLSSDATRSETGRAEIDLREAFIKLRLVDWLDLKLGRQVATWGTGELVFANNLFAKDWEAFFTGLDDAYLESPQDLLWVAVRFSGATVEIALSPYFTPDRLPDGERLSVYNPFFDTFVSADAMPRVAVPGRRLDNSELFGRLIGQAGSYDWALYGYSGFWPTPQQVGFAWDDFAQDYRPYLAYPALSSGGFSLRSRARGFLLSAEGALYYSEDDSDGDDPLIANSELRGIFGLERSLGGDWSVGAQYYGISMLDYAGYEAGFPQGAAPLDKLRSTATLRVNRFLLDRDLQLSLFAFVGIDDEDWHLRPALHYQLTDAVRWTLGANFMGGEFPYTPFGQLEHNASIYTRLRYSL